MSIQYVAALLNRLQVIGSMGSVAREKHEHSYSP